MQAQRLKKLTPREIFLFARDEKSKIEVTPSDLKLISKRREKLLKKAKNSKIYGVNTGFGLLADTSVPADKLEELQKRLIQSHATGVGPKLSDEVVRTMLLLRILNLLKPESCASENMIRRAIECFNEGIVPLIPEMGSVGASGDLAPLAHLATIFTGDGKGKKFKSSSIQPMKKLVNGPVELGPKDGLAFINGVQGILSLSCYNLHLAQNLLSLANVISCASLEGFLGTVSHADERLFESRAHSGMQVIAKHIRELMKGSKILESHKDCGKVQDPYSFRCIPQVHGSVYTVLKHIEEVLKIDIDSASDNPLVFETGNDVDVISGGNFHGMPLALAQDYLAPAITTLANISERRAEKLINPSLSGLPAFLSKDPGLNSGMMIVQVSAASVCNRMKTLCWPSSCDTIPTSADKEDHVSMGMTSAIKARDILHLFAHVLSLEAIVACQSLEFRRPLKSSKAVEWLYEKVRQHVKPMNTDHFLGDEIESLTNSIIEIAEENPWNLFG